MSSLELLLGRASTALLAAVLLGMFVRGRWRLWYSFTLLVFFTLVHSVLVSFWPQTFHVGSVWMFKEFALLLARIAMVIEITARVFRGFPGAMATARRLVVLILVVTFVLAFIVGPGSTHYAGFVGELMPRLLNGTIWLFTSLAILILWYRLPVHWFPKAVLLSYVPYLLIFTVALNALGELGWQKAAWADRANVIAYAVLLLYWTWLAWRREPARRARPQDHPKDRLPPAA